MSNTDFKWLSISGFASWVNGVDLLNAFITKSFTSFMIWQSLGHILFYMVFSVLFGFFWVKTSGMDAQSQAKNIMNSVAFKTSILTV